jgi:hypothetical protein
LHEQYQSSNVNKKLKRKLLKPVPTKRTKHFPRKQKNITDKEKISVVGISSTHRSQPNLEEEFQSNNHSIVPQQVKRSFNKNNIVRTDQSTIEMNLMKQLKQRHQQLINHVQLSKLSESIVNKMSTSRSTAFFENDVSNIDIRLNFLSNEAMKANNTNRVNSHKWRKYRDIDHAIDDMLLTTGPANESIRATRTFPTTTTIVNEFQPNFNRMTGAITTLHRDRKTLLNNRTFDRHHCHSDDLQPIPANTITDLDMILSSECNHIFDEYDSCSCNSSTIDEYSNDVSLLKPFYYPKNTNMGWREEKWEEEPLRRKDFNAFVSASSTAYNFQPIRYPNSYDDATFFQIV